MFGFSLIRLAIYAAVVLGVLGGAYTGYRIWRHQIWLEGRNAALEAVAKVNAEAKQAADRVEFNIDSCFDRGGAWNVSTGKCDLGGATPSGISSLFGN